MLLLNLLELSSMYSRHLFVTVADCRFNRLPPTKYRRHSGFNKSDSIRVREITHKNRLYAQIPDPELTAKWESLTQQHATDVLNDAEDNTASPLKTFPDCRVTTSAQVRPLK